jgi:hypothetical protein
MAIAPAPSQHVFEPFGIAPYIALKEASTWIQTGGRRANGYRRTGPIALIRRSAVAPNGTAGADMGRAFWDG